MKTIGFLGLTRAASYFRYFYYIFLFISGGAYERSAVPVAVRDQLPGLRRVRSVQPWPSRGSAAAAARRWYSGVGADPGLRRGPWRRPTGESRQARPAGNYHPRAHPKAD